MADETRQPKKEIREVWITADEAPDWMRRSTDEGAQTMQWDETRQRLVEQTGVRVSDDYVLDDEIAFPNPILADAVGPQRHPDAVTGAPAPEAGRARELPGWSLSVGGAVAHRVVRWVSMRVNGRGARE